MDFRNLNGGNENKRYLQINQVTKKKLVNILHLIIN